MNTLPSPERRRDVRVDVKIPIILKWMEPDGQEKVERIQTQTIMDFCVICVQELWSEPLSI